MNGGFSMIWKDNNKDNTRRNSDTNKYKFIKLSQQDYKGNKLLRIYTSKFLKSYLDEKELSFFKFGIDKKGSEPKLYILFSQEEDGFYALRNAKNEHKVNVSADRIVADLKEDGIVLPLERLRLEEATEEKKVKFGLKAESYLFEVLIPSATTKD